MLFRSAFAGGAVTGAVIGLMMAPDKGSNTRHKIMDNASNCACKAKMKLKDFLDHHGVKIDSDHIQDMVDDIMPHIEEKLED